MTSQDWNKKQYISYWLKKLFISDLETNTIEQTIVLCVPPEEFYEMWNLPLGKRA